MRGLDPQLVWWLLPFLAAGHLALWVGVFNRLHALNLSERWIHRVERFLVFPAAAFLPLVLVPATLQAQQLGPLASALLAAYYGLGAGALLLAVVGWVWRETRRKDDEAPLLENHTEVRDWNGLRTEYTTGRTQRWAARLPKNEILQLHVHHKRLEIPKLPPELQGLTIAQLSDFHFTGKFTAAFYRALVEQSNQRNPDIVCVTGDLVDKAHCLPWVPETFGHIQSRYGVFYILGNHDLRVGDVTCLRRMLNDCGLQDVGGKWLVHEINAHPCLIAGDERPWIHPGPDLSSTPEGLFRILLAHTPDRFPWATTQSFDLVLAGHTHGGQIRLPVIGPMVCPSAYGVRYASGVFRDGDCVMHVTRGLCGVHPLRFGCPPELSILTLHASSATPSA